MKEYEYSFKVKDLKPYIDYCKRNNYKHIFAAYQTRVVYKNNSNMMARITTNKENDIITKELDFKEDLLHNPHLVEREETKPIRFNDDKEIMTRLESLNYKKFITLVRTRTIYENYGVKFELDEYYEPEHAYVVAIEGNKPVVDLVYKEIINL